MSPLGPPAGAALLLLLLRGPSPAGADANMAAPPPNPCTDAACVPVFYAGLNGSKCYRIPSIIQTHAGTLLAFSENRLNGCGDQGTHNLVVRRSADGGTTWGPLITVFVGVTPCPGCPAAVSNPNPVEVTFPNGSRAVLLAFDTMNNPSSTKHGLDMMMWSHDDGMTWGGATTLAFPPESNVGSLIGPAVGLQAADGTLFVWITKGYLIVSHDYGASWVATQRASIDSECSIAFAADAQNRTIIMNCRSGRDHRRAQFYWTPSGDTYVPSAFTYPDEFTDPGCQGSIFSADGALFTSNAASTSAREGMTIHRSGDHGASWSGGMLLHAGPSAYSQLVGLGGGQLGVLFEAGVHGAYETISYAPFRWVPPPAPTPAPPPTANQRWTHAPDGTLTTDGGAHCLDWTSRDGHAVYMSACDPASFPHQQWNQTSAGHLTTPGADTLVLDWTSSAAPDGGHRVYMHDVSSSLPHQVWHVAQTLTADGGAGLCLDAGLPTDQNVEMRACGS